METTTDFFAKTFPTWIIAYCPDTCSWFCTNQRYFYYEYPSEFKTEAGAIKYFKDNVKEFIKLNSQMPPHPHKMVFLENNKTLYRLVETIEERCVE